MLLPGAMEGTVLRTLAQARETLVRMAARTWQLMATSPNPRLF